MFRNILAAREALNAQALEAIKAQRQRYKELREKLDTLPTSEEGKFEKYFSPEPGEGD